MHVVQLRLVNWMCFRGVNTLSLQPQAYAVFARHESDVERSNWLGKTALLEAFRFALTGEHRKRYEDGWITDGEERGGVGLLFSTGLGILRERTRGKSTQLRASPRGADLVLGMDERRDTAKGDEAQKLIAHVMGLTSEDFGITCYLEQRQTARLVTADPAERTRYVNGWLQLEQLKAAEAHNAQELSDKVAEADLLQRQLTIHEERLKATLTINEKVVTTDQLHKALKSAGEELNKAHSLSSEAARRQQTARAQRLEEVRAQEYEQLLRDIKPLADQLAKMDGEALLAAVEKAYTADTEAGLLVHTAQREAKQKQHLAAGEFDGHCPVANIACPAREQINDSRAENAKLYVNATTTWKKASEAFNVARESLKKAEAKLGEYQRLAAQVEALRGRAQGLLRGRTRSAGERVDEEDAARAHDRAQQHVVELTTRAESLAEKYSTASALGQIVGQTKEKLTTLHQEVQPLREAAVILGPRGAQRRVAEGALANIEHGANKRLAGSGVELQVNVRWESEGRGLAKVCYACGWPFPASERVKECARCQGERGPNIVNRLEFVTSSQSGGADDFAGIALQFSASEWLRRRREAAWALGLLDEPTAQMDAANRKAFARMLRQENAFEQLLVVAHHQATLDALPGRIQITATSGGSKVEVIT
jgi:DNA repair exonuclease SbcCD ATPase subunit